MLAFLEAGALNIYRIARLANDPLCDGGGKARKSPIRHSKTRVSLVVSQTVVVLVIQ